MSTTSTAQLTEQRFAAARDKLQALKSELSRVILGQDEIIHQLLLALFSGGHVLLEGLPGLGKTHLCKSLAKAMGLHLSRIQCTPDLMPADITGSEILTADGSGRRALEFCEGPVFSELVLVDEINRATPKAQSALLEAMQERQVTYMNNTYPLPEPFWVVASQNPIELEGTYPLPEAQLDRFLFKLNVSTPSEAALKSMLDNSLDIEPEQQVEQVLSLSEALNVMAVTRDVVVAETLKQRAVELILSTQPHSPRAGQMAQQHIRYGASPRGLQALVRSSRVNALMAGRMHLAEEDLAMVAVPVLRHRLILTMESEIQGMDIDQAIAGVVGEWSG